MEAIPGATFSIATSKDMFYLVVLESGHIVGLFTSPVDSHLRLKALGGAGRVVRMRANEDYNDTWTGSHDRADAPTTGQQRIRPSGNLHSERVR